MSIAPASRNVSSAPSQAIGATPKPLPHIPASSIDGPSSTSQVKLAETKVTTADQNNMRPTEHKNGAADSARASQSKNLERALPKSMKDVQAQPEGGPDRMEYEKVAGKSYSNEKTTGAHTSKTDAVAGARTKNSVETTDNSIKLRTENVVGLYGKREDKIEGKYGSAENKIEANLGAWGNGEVSGKIDERGLKTKLDAEVGVGARVKDEGKIESKNKKVNGRSYKAVGKGAGELMAGAEAKASGKIELRPGEGTMIAEGKAGVFAGVKAEGEAAASLVRTNRKGKEQVVFSAGVQGNANAGVGAEAHGKFGIENGTLHMAFGAGASKGYGADGGFEVAFNPKAAALTTRDMTLAAGKNMAKGAEAAWDASANAREHVSEKTQKAVDKFNQGAHTFKDKVSNAISS